MTLKEIFVEFQPITVNEIIVLRQVKPERDDQKFVFLKSFTSLVDQLNMWTMYGSDKSEGDDCNGCCVCLAPETFDLIIRRVEDEQKNTIVPLKFTNDDDFHLSNLICFEFLLQSFFDLCLLRIKF